MHVQPAPHRTVARTNNRNPTWHIQLLHQTMLGYAYRDLSASERDARRHALDSVGHYTVLSQLVILILTSIYRFFFCPWQPRIQSAFLRRLEWRLMTPLSWSSPESKSLADWGLMWGWFGWIVWLVVREAGDGMYHIYVSRVSLNCSPTVKKNKGRRHILHTCTSIGYKHPIPKEDEGTNLMNPYPL